jgi:hypothetical protein
VRDYDLGGSVVFASNFERILFYAIIKSDFSHESGSDFKVRFEKLRSYGRLPRGRENRARPLTVEQMADAVLGMTTVFPHWASHAATVLCNLRPVGGQDSSFMRSETLQAAIAKLLTNAEARKCFLSLSVSGAESGVNSNGYALLTYASDGGIKRLPFVSGMAASLMNPESLSRYDPDARHSSATREITFRPPFFEQLAREIEVADRFSREPEGDGSEYDDEEARAEHYRKLGVTSASRFLNIGVDNQVTWPKNETLVKFDKYHFVLMPKTVDKVQSVHVDLSANRLNDRDAMTVINRFLSVMTWCCDQYAIMQIGWSGNPVPVPVAKRDLAFATTSQWIFNRKIPATDDQRRALALYREARNAEDNFLVSYAVLNFFKVIEVKYPNRGDVKNWFRDKYEILKSDSQYAETLADFAKLFGDKKPHEYIYDSCRVAVSHVSPRSKSDPDDSHEMTRLHKAADVLKIFARWFIENELGVSDSLYSGD